MDIFAWALDANVQASCHANCHSLHPTHHWKMGGKQTDSTFVESLAKVRQYQIDSADVFVQVTYCYRSCRADICRLEPMHTSKPKTKGGVPLGACTSPWACLVTLDRAFLINMMQTATHMAYQDTLAMMKPVHFSTA